MFDFPLLNEDSMFLDLDFIKKTLDAFNQPCSPVPCPAPIMHLVDLFFPGWHLGPFLTRAAMRIDSHTLSHIELGKLEYFTKPN